MPRAFRSRLTATDVQTFLDSSENREAINDPEVAANILKDVRTRAESWRNGTAGVLALITAALVVTNAKDTARAYSAGEVRWLLSGLLIASAILGLLSLYRTLRAANGPSWLDVRVTNRLPSTPADGKRDMIRARAAAHDLWLAQRLLGAAVLVFILLVALTWGLHPANSLGWLSSS